MASRCPRVGVMMKGVVKYWRVKDLRWSGSGLYSRGLFILTSFSLPACRRGRFSKLSKTLLQLKSFYCTIRVRCSIMSHVFKILKIGFLISKLNLKTFLQYAKGLKKCH